MEWLDFASLVTSAIPSILFLAFIRGQVRETPYSWRPIALSFVFGMVAAAVAFFVFEHLELIPVYRSLTAGTSSNYFEKVLFFFVVVGPIEECLKLTATIAVTTIFGPLRRPVDALVLMSASALGFAFAENWYAMYATGGPDVGRAALVPFMHTLFSALCGWGLGESLRRRSASWPVYVGVCLASVYHGLFNVLVYVGGLWHYLTFPIVIVLWMFLMRNLRLFLRSSLRRS